MRPWGFLLCARPVTTRASLCQRCAQRTLRPTRVSRPPRPTGFVGIKPASLQASPLRHGSLITESHDNSLTTESNIC
jgi:hypothetical protein